jgi:hypothetical protein
VRFSPSLGNTEHPPAAMSCLFLTKQRLSQGRLSLSQGRLSLSQGRLSRYANHTLCATGAMISAAYAGVRNAMDQGNALALHVKVMASEETILSDCTGKIDAVKVPC